MIRRNLIIVFALILPCLLFANPTQDLIKKAGDSKKYTDNHLLLIYDSTKVEVKESGLSYFYIHRLFKVMTQKGALSLSVVKYDYDPLTAFADIVKVVIYRKDGTVENVDVKNVLDYAAPARAIYWGAREKMLAVGRLQPGDGLEIFLFKKGFSYALLADDDDRYIPPMYGSFYDIVPFWSDDAARTFIQNKVYHLSLPADKKLQYKFYYGEVETKQSTAGNMNIYTFTKKDIKPFAKEPMMVSLYDVAPKLLLSTAADWQSKSKWFYKVNEDYGSFESTPAIKAKVNEILKGAKNELDSVTRLTHWAGDEIRYSGISMGKGEGFTLHKGEMNFRDRCGVCKDKAGMLITMLRAAGFESYPAMTMAGSRIDEIPADHFNHCVTSVRLKDGKLHMLDPTWVPFRRELWSSAEQQQNYLIGTPQGEPLQETPVSPAQNHYVKINNNAELAANGTLNGELSIEAEGQSDAAVRSMFTGYFKAQWKDNAEKELTDVFPQAKVLSAEYGNPWDYLAAPVNIRIKYSIPDYAVVTGKEIFFKSLFASSLFKRAQNHLNFDTTLTQRKYPFRDRCSRQVTIEDNTKLPANYIVYDMPKERKIEGAAASANIFYKLNDNKLVYKASVVLNKRVYEGAEWANYRNVVAAQTKFNNEKIILINK